MVAKLSGPNWPYRLPDPSSCPCTARNSLSACRSARRSKVRSGRWSSTASSSAHARRSGSRASSRSACSPRWPSSAVRVAASRRRTPPSTGGRDPTTAPHGRTDQRPPASTRGRRLRSGPSPRHDRPDRCADATPRRRSCPPRPPHDGHPAHLRAGPHGRSADPPPATWPPARPAHRQERAGRPVGVDRGDRLVHRPGHRLVVFGPVARAVFAGDDERGRTAGGVPVDLASHRVPDAGRTLPVYSYICSMQVSVPAGCGERDETCDGRSRLPRLTGGEVLGTVDVPGPRSGDGDLDDAELGQQLAGTAVALEAEQAAEHGRGERDRVASSVVVTRARRGAPARPLRPRRRPRPG